MSAQPVPAMPADLPFSLTDAVRARAAGRTDPVALVEGCLARIETLEPDLRAWVTVDGERARATARHQAGLRAEERAGAPLLGVPVGIKDIIDVAGLPTLCGSPLRANHVADGDAPIVRVLRDLGAVVLGKTVTTQFACSDPSPTRNPWNVEHTPGGSSAGSAAATAAGMCYAALGTQTGGSITRPASFCGVASFKGMFGNWPMGRIAPVGVNLDHVGPHARTAADLALLWALVESRLRPARAAARLEAAQAVVDDTWLDRFTPPRLSLFSGYFEATAEPVAWAAFQSAVAKLEAAGAVIDELTLPPAFEGMHDAHRTVMAVEAAGVHRADFAARPDAFAPGIAALIETGLATPAVAYRAALDQQGRLRRELAATLRPGATPAVGLCPASVTTAPPSSESSTGDPQFNAVWSFSGLPTCAVPAALADDGLPVSLQLAAAGESFALFQVAGWCDRVLGFPLLGR